MALLKIMGQYRKYGIQGLSELWLKLIPQEAKVHKKM